MRWRVAFLTASYILVPTHAQNTHTHTNVNTQGHAIYTFTCTAQSLCIIHIGRYKRKSLLIEVDPISWFGVMVLMH